jgi:hypothetical protein
MKRVVAAIILIVSVVSLFGCSVMMAMSGEREPELGAFGLGSHRSEVEMQLGAPVASITTPEGLRLDTYEYQIGNEPSAARAIGHGALDIVTLGIWEVVGTPVEGFQGEKCRMTICYDGNDRVVAINRTGRPSTSDDTEQGIRKEEGSVGEVEPAGS